MKVSAVLAMKKMAEKNFKFKDISFIDFEKLDVDEMLQIDEKGEDFQAIIEVWANMSISYEGTPPESYRTLNSMIMDWVDDNEDKIKKLINTEMKGFLEGQYKGIDTSDLDEDFDDYIWEDQVDYMPEIDEDKKDIKFTIELVLEVEDDPE